MGHGEPAPRLCNKDPFALKSLSYLSRIFPKAKFVLMLRDGRATVHSMISRKVSTAVTGGFLSREKKTDSSWLFSLLKPCSRFAPALRLAASSPRPAAHPQVTISGFDLSSYRDCLTKWSSAVETMFSQCLAAGESRCLAVRYEQLVLHTHDEMRKLLNFLELQWDPSVLRHQELIGKAGGVSLSK